MSLTVRYREKLTVLTRVWVRVRRGRVRVKVKVSFRRVRVRVRYYTIVSHLKVNLMVRYGGGLTKFARDWEKRSLLLLEGKAVLQ